MELNFKKGRKTIDMMTEWCRSLKEMQDRKDRRQRRSYAMLLNRYERLKAAKTPAASGQKGL